MIKPNEVICHQCEKVFARIDTGLKENGGYYCFDCVPLTMFYAILRGIEESMEAIGSIMSSFIDSIDDEGETK